MPFDQIRAIVALAELKAHSAVHPRERFIVSTELETRRGSSSNEACRRCLFARFGIGSGAGVASPAPVHRRRFPCQRAFFSLAPSEICFWWHLLVKIDTRRAGLSSWRAVNMRYRAFAFIAGLVKPTRDEIKRGFWNMNPVRTSAGIVMFYAIGFAERQLIFWSNGEGE
jgi:hypothetical protein